MRPLERVGDRVVSHEAPYVIAEVGVNHEGSLSMAFELIDAAAEAGADMVKFQSYKAATLASRFSPAYWDRREEPASSQFELFRRYDSMTPDDYAEMAERCRERGVAFGSTPFDLDFVRVLDPLVPLFKIASADLTNQPLLEAVADSGKPIVLSTGAAHLGEIEQALSCLDESGATAVALLHCTLEYPTPLEHANLRTIPYLERVFPRVSVGYSDHVPPRDGCDSLFAAWMLGAVVLEKHFTLDKSLTGNDHYHAMDPEDLRQFVRRQRECAAMLGIGGKIVPASEEAARKYARRSLVAARDLEAGAVLAPTDFEIKRPGTGIAPQDLPRVVGARLLRSVTADEVFSWSDFVDYAEAPKTVSGPV